MQRGTYQSGRHRARRSRSRLKMAAFILVGIILLASVAWAFLGPDKQKETNSKQPTSSKQSDEEKAYQKQIATKLTFTYGGKQIQPASKEIASWYGTEDSKYELDSAKVASYIQTLGNTFSIQVKDASKAADAAISALTAAKDTTITLENQVISQKTYTYCTDVRGVSATELPALRTKLASTYTDPRGWGLGGLVTFQAGTSGCDFTVWLAANDQMTSFGGVCDVIWSCRSGDNVVLNFDRWNNASPTWNDAGLPLDEYRSMLINHETGHRLGFSHRQCTAAGDPAPVMQQQSINLNGCVFNAWPVQAELDTFHKILGL